MKKIITLLVLLFCTCGTAYAYNTANLPRQMLFSDAIEIFHPSEITGGYLSSADDRKKVDLTLDECREFYNACSDLVLARDINPSPFSGVAVNLYTGSTLHTFYINSGVQIGLFGSNNYVCYSFNDYLDEIMVMYSKYTESTQKQTHTEVNINKNRDFLKLPAAEWAKQQVKDSAENSLLPYEFVNKFNTSVSREDFCILLANMIAVSQNYSSLEKFMSDKNIAYLRTYFTDCEDADDSINMLHALGIVNGKSENTFDPTSPLTRQEAAVLLTNAAKMLGTFPVTGYLTYADTSSVSEWAKNSVLWVSAYKIMSGINDTDFAPLEPYTVEQAITTVNRLYSLIK